MLPTKFQLIWPNGYRREDFLKSANHKHSIEITHFVLIHLQTWLPQVIPVLDWSISKNLLI
jgi:hypothetical protein